MNTDPLGRHLFGGVNRVFDPRNLTDLEKMHLPEIDAPEAVRRGESFPVTVEVGRARPHPNDRGHFVEFIELYADDFLLAHVGLTAVSTCPKVTLHVSLVAPARALRAFHRCNLHGVWVCEAPIRVTD